MLLKKIIRLSLILTGCSQSPNSPNSSNSPEPNSANSDIYGTQFFAGSP